MKNLILFMSLVFFTQPSSASEAFLLPTEIGGIIYQDVLEINDDVMMGAITGTLEVPGVFKVPLENGVKLFRWAGTSIHFTITVPENGQNYKVHYRLFHAHDGRISGSLQLDDKTIIGKVEKGSFLPRN
jgi:hypothetical protein